LFVPCLDHDNISDVTVSDAFHIDDDDDDDDKKLEYYTSLLH
ncbi:hypothetical protein AC249_AIPGENE1805, partial [Exaiptasia diaphana]